MACIVSCSGLGRFAANVAGEFAIGSGFAHLGDPWASEAPGCAGQPRAPALVRKGFEGSSEDGRKTKVLKEEMCTGIPY